MTKENIDQRTASDRDLPAAAKNVDVLRKIGRSGKRAQLGQSLFRL
jgi:hypothetical protein